MLRRHNAGLAPSWLLALSQEHVRAVPQLKDLNAIGDLWELWDKGVFGQLPYRVLEEKYGTKWRADPKGDKEKNNSKRW